MDDFLIISDDDEYLSECQKNVERYLNGIRFELNPKKTIIYPLRKGIEFLGFEYRLTDTGKVLMTVKSSNVKRECKKTAEACSEVKTWWHSTG